MNVKTNFVEYTGLWNGIFTQFENEDICKEARPNIPSSNLLSNKNTKGYKEMYNISLQI